MISSFRLNESVGKIATTFLNYSTRSTWKEVAQFEKMMEKLSYRQKKSNSPPTLIQRGVLSSAYGNEGTSKRIVALNKIYMEQITMLVNSGTCGRQLADLGIEISKVKLATGLNFLNIYWMTRRTDIPEEVIHETLKGLLPELQQQMGSIRHMTKVPFLKFVKDLRLERELHLERIFESADFGKDFQPTFGKKVITPDFVPKPEEFPKMRQNVLGLDHSAIKGRILAHIFRHKAIKIDRQEDECEEKKQEYPQKLIKFSRQEFLKFYKRKRSLQLKLDHIHRKKEDEYYYPETYADEFENEPEFEEDDFELDLERAFKFENEDEFDLEYKLKLENEDVLECGNEDEHENENEDEFQLKEYKLENKGRLEKQ